MELPQLQGVLLLHPCRRAIEQPEQRRRLRRKQTLQPDQIPSKTAKAGALGLEATGEKVVFDAVDLRGRLAHDLAQHIGLVVQETHDHCEGGWKRFATVHSRAQSIQRAQRLAPDGDEPALIDAQPERRDSQRFGEREVVDHVVQDCDQGAIRLLDLSRARPFAQRLEEGVGQIEMCLQPFLGCNVGRIEVEPDELALLLARSIAQPRARLR